MRKTSTWHPSLPRLRRDESNNSCARRRTRGHCALSAMLTVSQLSKSFAGRPLFDDVSLHVNRAARFGLVGPNGAGKSTSLALLPGDVARKTVVSGSTLSRALRRA